MKKLISTLIAVILIFSVSACKPEPAKEKKVRAKFFAIGTRNQLKALTQYMKDNGIKYGKVD